MSWVGDQFDLTLNWDDIAQIKEWWGGKLVLKGIFDPEDARLAVKAGADALVVSNHGGRQLDSTDSSISMLPVVCGVWVCLP
jgi:L-lactate dehydrogenase (cytochrome)